MYIIWQNLLVSSVQFLFDLDVYSVAELTLASSVQFLLDLHVYSMAELVVKFSSIPYFFLY